MHCVTCILALAITLQLAHCWDYAITYGDQIEFYNGTQKLSNDGARFRELTALAYDAVHNMLLFVDKQHDNTSIFSYHIASKKYSHLVKKKVSENIQGLAFDPVEGMLFWTDTIERSIYWISMKQGSVNDPHGNLLLKMDDELPRAIAVESCRGYIYWTNTNVSKPTIERARFNGSDRKVIIQDSLYMPVSIAVDQYTKKLYWADDTEGIHYTIESSDLDGNNRQLLLKDQHHEPNSLAVGKDFLYWIEWGYHSVWRLPKTPSTDAEPEQLFAFPNKSPRPFGIVANYPVSEQISNQDCEALARMIRNATAVKETFVTSSKTREGIYCLHGEMQTDKVRRCKCTPGYIGDRCETSVCHNYCLQGDCSFTKDGQPSCSCASGYTGSRCEVSLCSGYCLNQGTCVIDQEKPVCHCLSDYEGLRCERSKPIETTTARVVGRASCNCTSDLNNTRLQSSNEFDFATDCDSWDAVRDPILMVLGIISGVLTVACTYLITKVLQLKRRPRIKKRIIVNKNVTPLTARPDQCEITIENCCNMNICETPCFEPRSTIRPTLIDAKPGKEEKKNLIANMEQEDY